jgi:hypothetical protein
MDCFSQCPSIKKGLVLREMIELLSQTGKRDNGCFLAGFSEDKVQFGDIEILIDNPQHSVISRIFFLFHKGL